MYFGRTETRVLDKVSGLYWQGRCDFGFKYKPVVKYKDINGVDRVAKYDVTFDLTFYINDIAEETLLRTLINKDEVVFYPRYFDEYQEGNDNVNPVNFAGSLIIKSADLQDLDDEIKCTLTSRVDEVVESPDVRTPI